MTAAVIASEANHICSRARHGMLRDRIGIIQHGGWSNVRRLREQNFLDKAAS